MSITIEGKPSKKGGSSRAPHVTYFPPLLPVVSEYYLRQSRRLDSVADQTWFDNNPMWIRSRRRGNRCLAAQSLALSFVRVAA